MKSKIRCEINKGLKNCYVTLIKPSENAEKLYNVYLRAFARYKKADKPSDWDSFKATCIKHDSDQTIQYYGVFIKDTGEICGYSLNHVFDECVNYSTIKYVPEHLSKGISAALIYTMNAVYLKNQGKKYVYDGERSIRHDTNVQDYLIKQFGFRKAFSKLNMVYRWYIKVAINCIFPFRNMLKRLINITIVNNLYALFELERIKRGFS